MRIATETGLIGLSHGKTGNSPPVASLGKGLAGTYLSARRPGGRLARGGDAFMSSAAVRQRQVSGGHTSAHIGIGTPG